MIGGKGFGVGSSEKGAPGKHKSFKSAFWGSLEKEKRRNKNQCKEFSLHLDSVFWNYYAHPRIHTCAPAGPGRQATCSARKVGTWGMQHDIHAYSHTVQNLSI